MPEPFDKSLSIDKYFYTLSKNISNYIYFINPNIITIFNFFVSFVIFLLSFYNLVWNGYFFISMILLIFRSFLDILDGAHARNLKKTSEVGAFLDCTNDLLFIIVNCFQYSLRIPLHYIFFKIIFLLISLSLSIQLLLLINRNEYNLLTDVPKYLTGITMIIHDNTIISGPLIFLFLDFIVDYLRKN